MLTGSRAATGRRAPTTHGRGHSPAEVEVAGLISRQSDAASAVYASSHTRSGRRTSSPALRARSHAGRYAGTGHNGERELAASSDLHHEVTAPSRFSQILPSRTSAAAAPALEAQRTIGYGGVLSQPAFVQDLFFRYVGESQKDERWARGSTYWPGAGCWHGRLSACLGRMRLTLAWSCALWVWGREWAERSAPFKLRARVLASPLRGLPRGDADEADRAGCGYPLRRTLERAGGA